MAKEEEEEERRWWKRGMKSERKASARSGTPKVEGAEVEELTGNQRDTQGGGRRAQKLLRSTKEGERETPERSLSLSLCPFAHRYRGFTRVSLVSHSKFPVPHPLAATAGKGERRRTAGVRERAMPRMTQVPQSLTRLRLFCHLLLSFELFYRLPR